MMNMKLFCIFIVVCLGRIYVIAKHAPIVVEECLHDVKKVQTDFVNVAYNANVTTADSMEYAKKLVDADRNERRDCAKVLPSKPNFMQVDLGDEYYVYGMYLLNGIDYVLEDVSIFLGETPDSMELYFHHHGAIREGCSFAFKSPVVARFVKVSKGDPTDYSEWSLCELEVYSFLWS